MSGPEVIVAYDCRVYVHVDVETGEVERVVCDDGSTANPELIEPGTARVGARAIEIAESADWPAWEFGW